LLPDGALHALTTKVPHTFGGLTKAMLQRSVQFAGITGRNVVVLTLEWEPALDDIRSSLRERGLLVDGVTILNLWEELEAAGDEAWMRAPFDPAVSTAELHPDDPCVTEIRNRDGTVRARQLRRSPDLPVGILRTEILDRAGGLLGGWNGTWPLWRWWLRRVLPTQAHLIVDAADAACCLAAAPLANVPTTYVMHNNHLSENRSVPYGRIERRRSFTASRAGQFDAVVTLTDTQRRDIELLNGTQNHIHVVPNAFDPTPTPLNRGRPAGRGIVMARLVRRKRVEHAVRAVAEASERASNVELAIFGTGPQQERITSTIAELSPPAQLEGHTHDPASAFAASSYMLLTSTREGFPLVLAESMAAGCLPIAYDLAYGPSDIVRDGIDGFVVPADDVKALAARIVDVATMRRRHLRRMRKKARRRAKDFSSAAVIPRWGPVLEAAAARAARRANGPEFTHAELTELERVSGLHRVLDCRLEATAIDLTWDAHGVADLLLECTIRGAGERTGSPHVDVELVHRPTGARFQPLPVDVLAPDPEGPSEDPTTTVRVSLDTMSVGEPDHVLLVRAQLGEIHVVDTVGLPEDSVGWLPMPTAAPRRPVLVPHRREGLRLITVKSHATATATVSADSVELEISSIDKGVAVGGVEATSLDDGPALTADRVGSGKYRLDLMETGLWKIRARIGDRWRDVAWRGPDPVPESDGPVHVQLTPRGNLRLRHD
jgi:poly(glycerol-phosphate) alpha-glucosyltransferase